MESRQAGSHLLVLVPGERLGGQDEPVLLGASLHDADVDGQPAFPDHLRRQRRVTGGEREKGAGRQEEGGVGSSQSIRLLQWQRETPSEEECDRRERCSKILPAQLWNCIFYVLTYLFLVCQFTVTLKSKDSEMPEWMDGWRKCKNKRQTITQRVSFAWLELSWKREAFPTQVRPRATGRMALRQQKRCE